MVEVSISDIIQPNSTESTQKTLRFAVILIIKPFLLFQENLRKQRNARDKKNEIAHL